MKLGPLMATSIGSLPRPTWLAATERSRATFRLEGEALRQAQDDATVLALREQEDIGLDILTDGEQRRESFVYHAAATWDGIDMVNQREKETYRNRKSPHVVPRITGQVKRRAPACLEEVRFAKAHTRCPIKVAVAGPMTVIDSTINEAYADEAELAMDIATAVNAELIDLQAAGCDMLQLDEPAMTRYHDKVFTYGARALDRCLEGVRVPTFVHLCFGYPGGLALQHQFAYPQLLEALLQTRIGGLTVEFARSDFDPSVLKPCRDRLIMFGCIDPGDTPAPAVAAVKARVRSALQYLDPERLLLAPDCGLMTISRSLAREKLQVMVEAAAQLRREL
ncbi:MAG TPA: 5-methyltetrahydropteroyltriglutamate--homocysteine methyltransferase [Xanthobacteraceae bacterium]